MKDYRTKEQFDEILESATNGNWEQAKKEVIEYGFFANDLIKMYNENIDEYSYFPIKDLSLLIPDSRE